MNALATRSLPPRLPHFIPLFLLLAFLLVMTAPAAAQTFIQNDNVNIVLDGCRQDGKPVITLPIGGKYVCPDANYTSGNLGKIWAELDLVPHRLITQRAPNSTTPDFSVIIGADYSSKGNLGYDHIYFFPYALNTTLSDASCHINNIGDEKFEGTAQSPFGQGVDTIIYRELDIGQAVNTTCVFDWVERLAIGSALYPGSSLQDYMFETIYFQHKQTNSINTSPTLAQAISKNMAAAENADYIWDIIKGATPASIVFPNTCDPNAKLSSPNIPITVTWTKEPAQLGYITVTTRVYAKNPANRSVRITVTDTIYSGTDPLGPPLTGTPVDLPPNTANVLVLEHKLLDVAAGTTGLNDVAIGTYVDTATGLDITQTTKATASATVQVSETNATSTVTDEESLGNPFLFSVDSTTGASGSFTNYNLGDHILGPLDWTSVTQSNSSSITFNKTIYASLYTQGNSQLQDTAKLTASNGYSTQASLQSAITVSAAALVNVTITKTASNGPLPPGSAAQSFSFTVLDSKGNTAAHPTITLNAGDTSQSTLLKGLSADTYTITEDDPGANWTRGDVTCGGGVTCNNVTNGVAIILDGTSAAACANTVTFKNAFVTQGLTATKGATTTFDRTYQWAITKDVDKTLVKTSDSKATFNYTVTVNATGHTDSNYAASGTITVNNPNFFPVAVNVTDENPLCTVTGGTGLAVPANGSSNVAYSCSFGNTLVATNTADITWGSKTYYATANLVYGTPTNVKDGSITVTDPWSPNPPLPATVTYSDTLPKSFQYAKTVDVPPGTCKGYDNTAKFTTNTTATTGTASQTVKACGYAQPLVTKTANSTFSRSYKWGITKDVDQTYVVKQAGDNVTFNYTVKVTHDGGTDSAWQAAGDISVKNPNDFEDITVTVTDAVNNGGACSVTGGVGVSVAAGKTIILPYTCSYAAAPNPASGLNTATAVSGTAGTGTGNANVVFGAPTTLIDGSVNVTDTFGGTLGTVTYTDGSPKTFQYSKTVIAPSGTCSKYDNTATFTTNTSGTTGSASQSVKACGEVSLTVSKTANPYFQRAYSWQISKTATPDTQTIPALSWAIFNYGVTASQIGITDSLWKVSGNIDVTNPNDFEDIPGVNITDVVNNGGGATCTVTGGTNVTVLSKTTKTVTYSCTYGSQPTYSGINTATATWGTGSATGTAAFVFATPNALVNKTVTITDTYGGTLGSLTATDSSPDATGTWTYQHSFQALNDHSCHNYPNTATITETNQTASKTVQVCPAYALTSVVKTVQGVPPSGTQAFTFQLRQGASSTQNGTILESEIANAANGGIVNFTTQLVPGATYQMCEIIMPGWSTTLGTFVPNSFIPPDGIAPNPNVDNSILCVNFLGDANAGTTVFTVDNTPPPGGRALTIGFWKNWSSCTKGGQKPTLDQTLALFEPTGLVVSATSGIYPLFGPTYYLQLHGSVGTPTVAPSCKAAVNLLNKSTMDKGAKKASDPAFNLVAQLIAAELNYGAGAGKTPKATTAINQAVLLLGKYAFNGNIYTPKLSPADAATMNSLATTLDNYNNDRP